MASFCLTIAPLCPLGISPKGGEYACLQLNPYKVISVLVALIPHPSGRGGSRRFLSGDGVGFLTTAKPSYHSYLNKNSAPLGLCAFVTEVF